MHRVLYSCERHESTEGYHVCRLCHSEWRGRYYRDLRIKSIAHQPHPRTRVMGLPRNRMAPVGVLPERSPSYVDSAQRAWTTSPTRDSSETGLKRDTFSTPVAHAFPLSPLCEGHALLTHLPGCVVVCGGFSDGDDTLCRMPGDDLRDGGDVPAMRERLHPRNRDQGRSYGSTAAGGAARPLHPVPVPDPRLPLSGR